MDNHIIVRAREPRDLDDLFEILQQPRFIWGTLQLPHPSYLKTKERVMQDDPGRTSLVAEIEGKVVGMLSIGVQNRPRVKHVGGIGMGVHDAYQGRGVGTALMGAAVELADKWLNLSRLELTVFVDNGPAIALYTKFGFEEEGRSRASAFRDGKYVDSLYMARVRL